MSKTMVIAGMMLASALAGCGSSGASSDGGGGHGAGTGAGGGGGAGGATTCAPLAGIGNTSTGTMSWDDNGVLQCASFVITERTTATVADSIEIDAATTAGTGADIALSTSGAVLGGTYTCQTGTATAPNVMFEVTGTKSGGFAAMSDCSITINFTHDSAGAEHAQGTFSGSVSGDAGTEVVTNGMFDLTVMVLGG